MSCDRCTFYLPKSHRFRNFDGTSSLTEMSFALMTIYENTQDLSRAHLIWWLALKKRICNSYVNPSSALLEEVALKEIPSYKFCVWIVVSLYEVTICRWAFTKWLHIWNLALKTDFVCYSFSRVSSTSSWSQRPPRQRAKSFTSRWRETTTGIWQRLPLGTHATVSQIIAYATR